MSRARTKSSLVLPTQKAPLAPTISLKPSSQTVIDNADDDDFGWLPGYEFPGRCESCDRWCAPLHLVENRSKENRGPSTSTPMTL